MTSRELLRAILKGSSSDLDRLLNEGGDIHEITETERWTYLHRSLLAVSMPPSADMLRVLVARGLDVNAVDSYGNTPLHYAARLGRADLVATLIEAGAGVNAINREGVSPLRQALLSVPRSHEAVERLIAAEADPEQRNGDGLSVRDFARATAGGEPELLALFDSD